MLPKNISSNEWELLVTKAIQSSNIGDIKNRDDKLNLSMDIADFFLRTDVISIEPSDIDKGKILELQRYSDHFLFKPKYLVKYLETRGHKNITLHYIRDILRKEFMTDNKQVKISRKVHNVWFVEKEIIYNYGKSQ